MGPALGDCLIMATAHDDLSKGFRSWIDGDKATVQRIYGLDQQTDCPAARVLESTTDCVLHNSTSRGGHSRQRYRHSLCLARWSDIEPVQSLDRSVNCLGRQWGLARFPPRVWTCQWNWSDFSIGLQRHSLHSSDRHTLPTSVGSHYCWGRSKLYLGVLDEIRVCSTIRVQLLSQRHTVRWAGIPHRRGRD